MGAWAWERTVMMPRSSSPFQPSETRSVWIYHVGVVCHLLSQTKVSKNTGAKQTSEFSNSSYVINMASEFIMFLLQTTAQNYNVSLSVKKVFSVYIFIN